MTSKEIRAMFPITVKVTEKHIQLANEKGGLHYLGNVLLEEVFPKEIHDRIFWGLSIGSVGGVEIKTECEEVFKGKKEKFALYVDKNCKETTIKFELR